MASSIVLQDEVISSPEEQQLQAVPQPCAGSPQGGAWVQLVDGVVEHVEEEVLAMAPYLRRQQISGFGSAQDQPIVLPRQVTRAGLALVQRYAEFHADTGPCKRSDKERKQFDERFVKLDTKQLCELTAAADSLEMRGLVDMTSKALAKCIEGRSPDEIRQQFNLPDDLTEEEKLEPIRHMVDDPRIRLLNRLYAKKKRELQDRKVQAAAAAAAAAGSAPAKPPEPKQDNRSLEELLSFIEDAPASTSGRGSGASSAKQRGAAACGSPNGKAYGKSKASGGSSSSKQQQKQQPAGAQSSSQQQPAAAAAAQSSSDSNQQQQQEHTGHEKKAANGGQEQQSKQVQPGGGDKPQQKQAAQQKPQQQSASSSGSKQQAANQQRQADKQPQSSKQRQQQLKAQQQQQQQDNAQQQQAGSTQRPHSSVQSGASSAQQAAVVASEQPPAATAAAPLQRAPSLLADGVGAGQTATVARAASLEGEMDEDVQVVEQRIDQLILGVTRGRRLPALPPLESDA